jgi:uncharacterized protein with HEPN domain
LKPGGDTDALHLALMAEAICDLERRLSGSSRDAFLADRDEQALTAFRLAVLAENTSKLSAALKQRHPHVGSGSV